MQKVAAGVSDVRGNARYFSFGLLPVLAELLPPRHHALVALEAVLMFLRAVEWFDKTAIAQRGEAGNAHINADRRSARMCRLRDFAPGLDGDEALATR